MNKGHDKGHKGQMSDREVMRLALEALESAADNECNFHDYKHAITALRQALEQEPWDTTDMAHRAGGLSMEQEPVAWFVAVKKDGKDRYIQMSEADPEFYVPLYAAPPKREWVGLTDEEEIELDEKYGDDFNAYIDARDTKLKEKNT